METEIATNTVILTFYERVATLNNVYIPSR